jgi:hypothetical protein
MEYQSSTRQEHAALIQKLLAEQLSDQQALTDEQLAVHTRLRPDEINDAVELLVQRGHATCDYSQGRRPYAFTTVQITPEGQAAVEQPPSREMADALRHTKYLITRAHLCLAVAPRRWWRGQLNSPESVGSCVAAR